MLSPAPRCFAVCLLLLGGLWVGAEALTAEQLLDLQPGALQQYDTGAQLDADVAADELEIEQVERYLQLKELAEQRARLQQRQRHEHQQMVQAEQARQRQKQQLREPEFSYNFPPAPPSTFALRPSDPGYYFKLADNSPAEASSSSRGSELSDGDAALNTRGAPELQQVAEVPPPATQPNDAQPPLKFQPTSVQVSELADDQPGSPYHQQQVDVRTRPLPPQDEGSDLYFIAIVAGCSAAAIVGIIAIGISWYRLQKNAKAAADVEYPAYGVTGPNKETSPTGDRRLAQSAQMYHYQHQKQQIIAMESRTGANERPGSVSEAESEEEGEEGDYTVYECPGLAPTGEMEVKNPLFQDDPTPATPAPKAQEQQGEKPPQQP